MKRLRFLLFLFLPFQGSALFAETPKTNTLRIGLTGKYPPFNYYTNDGELTGFDVEIAEEICQELKRQCRFVPMAWDGILAALLSEKIDAIIGSMAITKERQKVAAFSKPYYESGAQLFVSIENSNPSTPGFRIGVTLGTTYRDFASKKFPNARISTYKGDVDILQDLKSGRLDGLITDKLVGLHMAKLQNTNLFPLGEVLFDEYMGIPVHPNKQQLLVDINQALFKIRNSKVYSTLLVKYFGEHSTSSKDRFSYIKIIPLLAKSLWTTINISLQGLLVGFLIACILTMTLLLTTGSTRALISFLVDFIRSTPFMVQLFAIYFGLASLNLQLNPWTSALLAIAIHSSAYLAEIFKVAYKSVPSQQHQAAKILGLSKWDTFFFVIKPQMLPVALTPSLNTMVAMIKDSAIISVISVHELMMQTQELISATFKPMEFYLIAAVLYFLITYPLLTLGRRLEKSFKSKGLLHG